MEQRPQVSTTIVFCPVVPGTVPSAWPSHTLAKSGYDLLGCTIQFIWYTPHELEKPVLFLQRMRIVITVNKVIIMVQPDMPQGEKRFTELLKKTLNTTFPSLTTEILSN